MVFESFHQMNSLVSFDWLSWTLFGLIGVSSLVHGYLSKNLSPKMHPLLLGRQADFSKVRKQSESPIVSSTGSVFGMLPVSPKQSIKSLLDMVLSMDGKLRHVDNKGPLPEGMSFKTLIVTAQNKIWSVLSNFESPESMVYPQLLILCSNPELEYVLTLAAATLPIATVVGTPSASGTIPIEVQLAYKNFGKNVKLVICDDSIERSVQESFENSLSEIKVLKSNQLSSWFEEEGVEQSKPEIVDSKAESKVLIVSSTKKFDEVKIFSFSSEQILAGITAALGVFPTSSPLSSTDLVSFGVDSEITWGYQFSFAAAAAHSGSDVCFFKDLNAVAKFGPTVLFINSATVKNLAENVLDSSKNLLTKISTGLRLGGLFNGAIIGPLDEAVEWVGPKARAIFTRGAITQLHANLICAGVGTTLQRVYCNPLSAGPILASQAYDFQTLQRPQNQIHFGPPVVNVECKVLSVPEPSVAISDAVKGELVIRGPTLSEEVFNNQSSKNLIEELKMSEDFLKVGEVVELQPNGTFKMNLESPSWDY